MTLRRFTIFVVVALAGCSVSIESKPTETTTKPRIVATTTTTRPDWVCERDGFVFHTGPAEAKKIGGCHQ